jgi:phosphatidate cytidylyltransferase
MKTRVALGTFLVALVVGLVCADHFLGTRVGVSALIALLALAGWHELAAMSGIRDRARGGGPWLTLLGFAGTAYFLALAWRAGGGGGGDEAALSAAGIAGVLLGGAAGAAFRSDHEKGLELLLVTLAGTLLLGLLFSYTLRLYRRPDGTLIALVLFFGVKGNDIAAYFAGRAFGRHRFLKVSPKKTLEGCGAALVFSVLFFVTVSLLWPETFFPWPRAVAAGIILSITSQVGDLCESLMKRAYHVKDSSGLLPEFGGVLDMVDSLLFSGLPLWFLLP